MTATPKPPESPPSLEPGSALRIGGAPKTPGLPAPSHGTDTPLPHERDQAVAEVASGTDSVMAQAKRDIDAGMVDTDMRATPGLDAERRAQLAPVPAPDASAGAGRQGPSPAKAAATRPRLKPAGMPVAKEGHGLRRTVARLSAASGCSMNQES